jgi:phosphatidylglycerophosphate synthase
MSAAERNRRVARRHGGIDRRAAREALTSSLPTLWVPAEAAITADLFSQLPPLSPTDSCRIIWHETHPPMLWRSTAAAGTAREVVVTAPAVLDVSTLSARQAAAWRLLKASGKPQDGWLSRHVHRKISRVLSYGCMALGVSANMATMLTFGVGLVAAYLAAQTTHVTMIAGAFLYWFASIADGVDGEVARMTLSESRFGEQLDTGVDQLTHLAALIGVLIGWWRQGIGAGGVALAVSVIVGTPATLLWAMTLVRRARRADQFFVPTKPIEIAMFRAAAETGARPLMAAAAVFVLFRREAFSCAFFVLSLVTAQRAAIPTVIGAALAIVVLTLAIYGRTLDRTLRETLGPRAAAPPTALPVPGSSAPA